MFVHLHGYELPVILGTDEDLNSERLPAGERSRRMRPPELPVAGANRRATVGTLTAVTKDEEEPTL